MKNRTLNRPMFRRGGKVDSRGTGITSGLMPRKNYAQGDLVTKIKNPGMSQAMSGDMYLTGSTIPSIPNSTQAAEYLNNQKSTVFPKLDAGFTDLLLGPNFKADSEKNISNLIEEQGLAQEEAIQNILATRKATNEVGNPDMARKTAGATGLTDQIFKQEETSNEDPSPPSDPNDTGDVDSRTRLQKIQEAASEYEKMLGSSRKEDIFDMLTAAAPGLLADDYGTAIKAAGEVGKSSRKVKQDAKLLAIQEQIDKDKLAEQYGYERAVGNKPTSKMLEINDLMAKGKMTYLEAVEQVYGSSDFLKKAPIERQVSDFSKAYLDQNNDIHAQNNHVNYGKGDVLNINYNIPTVKYKAVQNKEDKSKFDYKRKGTSLPIFWDPGKGKIIVTVGIEQVDGKPKSIVKAFGFNQHNEALAAHAKFLSERNN